MTRSQGQTESVRMRDLAEQVAAWEHDTTLEALTSKERQRVYIALYQSHLPKLDKLGVIDYNQSRGIVERTSAADQFDPYLDSYESSPDESTSASPAPDTSGGDAQPRWPVYNLAAVVMSTLLLGDSVAGGGFSVVSPVVAAVTSLGLFTAVTVGQLYVAH